MFAFLRDLSDEVHCPVSSQIVPPQRQGRSHHGSEHDLVESVGSHHDSGQSQDACDCDQQNHEDCFPEAARPHVLIDAWSERDGLGFFLELVADAFDAVLVEELEVLQHEQAEGSSCVA